MKTQLNINFKAVYETIYCLLSFSLSLMFGNKILKIMWIGLFVSTYFFIGSLSHALLFTVIFALSMLFIVILFIIGFGYILSRNRD
jgi:hypothetical protein